MKTEVIMVLGTSVWQRGPAGWQCETARDCAATIALVTDALKRAAPTKAVLVYEPAGMSHQELECPKASRSVFASISRVRSELPVVVSEELGWGMEPPVPLAGGSYSTLVHFELSEGLSQICSATLGRGATLVSAWSAYTAGDACLARRLPGSRDSSALVLLPGFVAYSSGNRGRRGFRVWPQPLAERDWRALVFLAAGEEHQPGRDGERRGGAIAVISEGEPTSLCPYWDEIRNSGRLECFVGLDELAATVVRLGRRHPGNLLLGFPRRLNIDPLLGGLAAAGIALAAMSCASAQGARTEFRRLDSESASRLSALEGRLAILERNGAEMTSLRRELPQGPDMLPVGRSRALRGLAEAIPDSITLTGFAITGEDRFELEALLMGRDFDLEAVRRALLENGFSMTGPGSLSFDPSTRRLTARGKIADPGK